MRVVAMPGSLAESGKSGGKSGAAAVKFLSAVFKFCCFFLHGFEQEQKYYKIAN